MTAPARITPTLAAPRAATQPCPRCDDGCAFCAGTGRIEYYPYAEHDTSAWDALFGDKEPWDAAPDLTAAYARSTVGMGGVS